MKTQRLAIPFILLGMVIAVALLSTGTGFAQAGEPPQFPPAPEPGIDNQECLTCHGRPDQQITLPSGEILYLTIDETEYAHSVHGRDGYACVQCHSNITGYPHPTLEAETWRDVTLSMYYTCARCHADKYSESTDDVHRMAQAAGNANAAVCSDCHGAHNIQAIDEQPATAIPETCERCHSDIYNHYAESIHGSALIGEGNPDVPTCIDCHGVHTVQGPHNSPLRLDSPLICAECHADPELMDKYGISTDVFDTYVADFHGTTLVLFDQEAEGQALNTPVCIDCHGVHDIRSSSDPDSSIYKSNLIRTCQKCHPDAEGTFSEAWLGHYRPDPQKFPVVYFVELFYRIFIPVVLGGMAILVVMDFTRRMFNRFQEPRHG